MWFLGGLDWELKLLFLNILIEVLGMFVILGVINKSLINFLLVKRVLVFEVLKLVIRE